MGCSFSINGRDIVWGHLKEGTEILKKWKEN
jgi:hypothetical protein